MTSRSCKEGLSKQIVGTAAIMSNEKLPFRQDFNAQSSVQYSSEKSPLVTSAKFHEKEEETSTNIFVASGKQLRRSLTFKHAFAAIVSILFGSGLFISPALIAKETSNMGMTLVVWVIGGILSLSGALCFCELTCMYRKTGTYYLFIFEAYGEVVAFMIIWIDLVILNPSGFTILSLTIGKNIIYPIPGIESHIKVWLVKFIAILAVISTAAVNCISVAFVGRTQIFFSAIQSLSGLFLVLLGVSQVATGHVENYIVMFNNTQDFRIGDFGLALYNALWAYDGWGSTASIAEELKGLDRNLWLSIVTGIPFVIIFYLFVTLALTSALTKTEIADSDIVATTFVARVLGTKASFIIPVAVAFSCFGSMIGTIFTHGRTYLCASREGQLPSVFSFIHKERRTPIPGLVFVCVSTTFWILVSSNELETFVTYFSIGVWLKYGLTLFSVLLMRRRKPQLNRPYRVCLANPVFSSLFSLFLVIIPFVDRPVESTVSLLVFLSALPVYFIFIKKHDRLPSWVHRLSDAFNGFLKKKCDLVPSVFNEIHEENTKHEKSYENIM